MESLKLGSNWSDARRYGVAFVVFALGLLLRYTESADARLISLDPFYLSVALVFMLCGWGPGLLTTLACVSMEYMVVASYTADFVLPGGGLLKLLQFLATAAVMAVCTQKFRHLQLAWKAAIADASQSAGYLEKLYSATPGLHYSTDLSGKILMVSDQWLETLGYQRNEVIGQYAAGFLTESSRRLAIQSTLPYLLAHGAVQNIEYQMHHRDGRIIDVLVSSVVEKKSSSDPVQILSSVTDITARKQAELALAASESRYKVLVEAQSELVSLATLDGRLTFVNAAYAKYYGSTVEAMVGTNFYDYVPPDDVPGLRTHLETIRQSTEAVATVNHVYSASGVRQSVAWMNRVLQDASGTPVAIHSVGRQLTDPAGNV